MPCRINGLGGANRRGFRTEPHNNHVFRARVPMPWPTGNPSQSELESQGKKYRTTQLYS